MEQTEVRSARRLDVHGTVQGVGFRPFVYRLATELGLDGSVRNDGVHVVIEAAAPGRSWEELVRRLRTDAPPLARVAAIAVADLPVFPAPGSGFRIDVSPSARSALSGLSELPPDIAPCVHCLHEIDDPGARRYRYPFTSCTSCGPRATVMIDLPYDRSRTTMAGFPLCRSCEAEYADPADRRFSAEPLACPACGPTLSWRSAGSDQATECADNALRAAEETVALGGIVAVKGLGGYQLVCDAGNESAVQLLRERKRRWAKPLAVMVRDLAVADQLAVPNETERLLLASGARPIVLVSARRFDRPALAVGIHPDTDRVGLFLPSTPLHHLLLRDLDRPLVVTSGNGADEPMAIDDAVAAHRLSCIADGFLGHDRPIAVRYDDSVVQVVAGRALTIRRARGYAPAPLPLPVPARVPLVAVGAQLKHTFTLANGQRAVMGPHTGDLEDADSFDSFARTLAHMTSLNRVEPRLVAHDLHPGYLSTQYAQRWSPSARIAVQHHHAHVAATAAEHGITDPFIGVAYDGLGLGDDGTLWGGEVLVGDLRSYRRVGRFSRAPLPGGAAAVRRPARTALGYLFGAEDGTGPLPPLAETSLPDRIGDREIDLVRRMVDRRINSPIASSAGRLFDAVAALLGLRDDAAYEGQAAVVLENAAAPGDHGELAWTLRRVDDLWVYDARPTLAEVVNSSSSVALTAARFHSTIAVVTVALCLEARREHHVNTVCLGGGVFQNRRLTADVLAQLASAGFVAHVSEAVPVNDGGISYGQAAVAAARTGGK